MRNPLIMHVHPSSPNSSISEENAATKIQANFRGYRVRKQIKDTSGVVVGGSGAASSCAGAGTAAALAGASSPMDQCGGHGHGGAEKRGAHDDRAQSATKIQAGIRGYLVRKKQKLATDAATKIQAQFRGFKTRQQLKQAHDH